MSFYRKEPTARRLMNLSSSPPFLSPTICHPVESASIPSFKLGDVLRVGRGGFRGCMWRTAAGRRTHTTLWWSTSFRWNRHMTQLPLHRRQFSTLTSTPSPTSSRYGPPMPKSLVLRHPTLQKCSIHCR